MDHVIELQDQQFSFMGIGSKISGTFHLKGATRLASHLEGELTMVDDSDLVIETEGSFKGNLKCQKIDIFGRFEGSLQASGQVRVFPSAEVIGDVMAESLVIYPGAILNMDGKTLH